MSALLREIAADLGGHLHPGAVRGAWERMHYTVDLGEGGSGADCRSGGVASVMRAALAAAARLFRRASTTTVRIRLELARPEDPAFNAEPVASALKARLREAGFDRATWDVHLSTTRLTVMLRAGAASPATVMDVLRTAARSAGEARSSGGEGKKGA